MDVTVVEDDICILRYEKSDFNPVGDYKSPVSASSGDVSVASHFALVTAYEDIKKRLKETERENSILKKKIRLLEEKSLYTDQEKKNVIGREQVNKAYHAYREVCIERDDLKAKLDKTTKEQESIKHLTEQLQSKEVELLQLKTEIETYHVMSDLKQMEMNCTVDKINSDLRIHSLQQESEILRNECNRMRAELKTLKDQGHQTASPSNEILQGRGIPNGEDVLLQTFFELQKEMVNLRSMTEVQAKVVRKLTADQVVRRKVISHLPVQCEDDVEQNCKVQMTGSVFRQPYTTLNEGNVLFSAVTLPLKLDAIAMTPDEIFSPWTAPRPNPVGSATFQEHNSYHRSSLDDNSWVVPNPPKPSDIQFWETRSNTTPSPVNFMD
ncbi:5-azacytidine-induced protein 2 isoform X2 [Protopterus annectens]|uniref:5-azacytidine-induced protein 2 isoform X2 n=1 Tax=Protopterus annectens TaxID=7888 RepID=UPI001CFB56E0|nr:5-azacytidine-induced protein 2 isoform X2 [Protopterus annectens]